jgi:hypothetical protein
MNKKCKKCGCEWFEVIKGKTCCEDCGLEIKL